MTNEWTAGAIKVGKDRYYWAVYNLSGFFDAARDAQYKELPVRDVKWMAGEGFETTLQAALDAAARTLDGRPTDKRRTHGTGDRWIRQFYKDYHTRKPKPSGETDARPEGALGSIWIRWVYEPDGPESEAEGWHEHPITKITAERVFVRGERGAFGKPGPQIALDRGELDANGYVTQRLHGRRYETFYSEAGKAAYEADRPAKRPDTFPLLGIVRSATREDIMSAFRRLARDLHPDAGGDAAAFRALVEEKNRALLSF